MGGGGGVLKWSVYDGVIYGRALSLTILRKLSGLLARELVDQAFGYKCTWQHIKVKIQRATHTSHIQTLSVRCTGSTFAWTCITKVQTIIDVAKLVILLKTLIRPHSPSFCIPRPFPGTNLKVSFHNYTHHLRANQVKSSQICTRVLISNQIKCFFWAWCRLSAENRLFVFIPSFAFKCIKEENKLFAASSSSDIAWRRLKSLTVKCYKKENYQRKRNDDFTPNWLKKKKGEKEKNERVVMGGYVRYVTGACRDIFENLMLYFKVG